MGERGFSAGIAGPQLEALGMWCQERDSGGLWGHRAPRGEEQGLQGCGSVGVKEEIGFVRVPGVVRQACVCV